MPINFPDGVLCREPGSRRRAPLQPPATWDGRGYETARDTDLLAAWRTLREHPAAVASRITRATRVRGVARYSDRGAARPHLTAGAFAASEHCTLRVGEHYPAELNPSGASARSAKRARAAAGPGLRLLRGASWAAATELEALEAAAQAGAEGEGSASEVVEGEEGAEEGAAGRRADGSRRDRDDGDGEGDGEEDGLEEDEDAILGDENGFDGFEDGGDDLDSGGEDEPEY